ncbi:monosaccharide ABC transporter membrane protein, CUT2 family (TC 3.A.1.2.-) [Cohaesibacter sp. ES.047]|uniref:ABC transporter permease n=1 Tax=Cohaesibacter sp. ES.047 TaxID=1798205 RepID=UPI000BBFCC06|nr:ABC transporter permease [Cohaesibacter sp. ES.047]SNY91073.1 monosaccharide ABC transporter membrane protein, CUT2 family (TC 3.A.1.2.-) [Cohaesibacter sp. ES.047]
MTATPVTSQRMVLPKGYLRRVLPGLLTLSAMFAILIVCGIIQPRIWSQGGLTLILSPIVALAIASMSQMVMMSIGDIDLSIGFFVGMVTAISATFLRDTPLLGVLALGGSVLAYTLLGALVELRSVPSLIATLGASFIWLGVGLFILPVPGGMAPDWLFAYAMWSPPLGIPTPLITMVVATALTWVVMQKTSLGVRFRALGSNPVALARSNATLLGTRMLAYTTVGVLGVMAGVTLTAEIGAGDVNAVPGYTLTTIAAVILGGGMFTGGRAVAWGTLFGAITLGLLTVLLTLLKLSSNLQPAVQAFIVIAVLAGRLILERKVK